MVRNTKRWNWEPKKIFEMRVNMREAMETELKRLKEKFYGDKGESAVERDCQRPVRVISTGEERPDEVEGEVFRIYGLNFCKARY